MKQTLVLFLYVIFFFNTSVYGEDAQPAVAAKGAVLIDMDSGRILWGKNPHEPMAMASTTKIMTAIIALERADVNAMVTVSKGATLAPKVKMNLQPGEEVRLYDLLLAMMLQSYNDAAVAVAEHVCGSVEEFCTAMNLKAKELGCLDTCFETPNGLDKGNHHSTPYDMALITRYALDNQDFQRLITTPSAEFTTGKGTYSFINKDRLLKEYEGAMGVKTGFTNKAGQCFVGAARRGQEAYISVVLASGWGAEGKEQKWKDTKALLDYGFDNYDIQEVITEGTVVGRAAVVRGKEAAVNLVCRDFVKTIVGKDEEISYKYEYPDTLEAPVAKGQRVGTCYALIGKEVVGESGLITDRAVPRKDFYGFFYKIIEIFLLNTRGNMV